MRRKAAPSTAAEIIYRAGAGVIFGNRLAMLEHVGRVSGERRYTILRIIDRPSHGSLLATARKGAESQWYLNVRANPYTRLYLRSRRPVNVIARPLPKRGEEAGHEVAPAPLVLFEIVGRP